MASEVNTVFPRQYIRQFLPVISGSIGHYGQLSITTGSLQLSWKRRRQKKKKKKTKKKEKRKKKREKENDKETKKKQTSKQQQQQKEKEMKSSVARLKGSLAFSVSFSRHS